MTTALTEAVHAVWREEVGPDRFLELRPCREGLMQHDSRVLIATGTLGPEAYLRLGQLGYIVADIARAQTLGHSHYSPIAG